MQTQKLNLRAKLQEVAMMVRRLLLRRQPGQLTL
jgi:hypothetical protein